VSGLTHQSGHQFWVETEVRRVGKLLVHYVFRLVQGREAAQHYVGQPLHVHNGNPPFLGVHVFRTLPFRRDQYSVVFRKI
jgi:hypothetical protein